MVALVVFVSCAAVLAYLHRDDLLPRAAIPAVAANAPLEACLAERVGAVDAMKSEGIVNDARYAAFRKRAEDYCHGQFGTSGPPPLSPP